MSRLLLEKRGEWMKSGGISFESKMIIDWKHRSNVSRNSVMPNLVGIKSKWKSWMMNTVSEDLMMNERRDMYSRPGRKWDGEESTHESAIFLMKCDRMNPSQGLWIACLQSCCLLLHSWWFPLDLAAVSKTSFKSIQYVYLHEAASLWFKKNHGEMLEFLLNFDQRGLQKNARSLFLCRQVAERSLLIQIQSSYFSLSIQFPRRRIEILVTWVKCHPNRFASGGNYSKELKSETTRHIVMTKALASHYKWSFHPRSLPLKT